MNEQSEENVPRTRGDKEFGGHTSLRSDFEGIGYCHESVCSNYRDVKVLHTFIEQTLIPATLQENIPTLCYNVLGALLYIH